MVARRVFRRWKRGKGWRDRWVYRDDTLFVGAFCEIFFFDVDYFDGYGFGFDQANGAQSDLRGLGVGVVLFLLV